MTLTWADILEHWDLLEFDFAAVFHVDLESDLYVKSWRWFTVRVSGLIAEPSCQLHAYARKKAGDG